MTPRYKYQKNRPGRFLPYIKVGVGDTLTGWGTPIIPGVLYCSMKAEMTDFDTCNVCPDCSADTAVVKLGAEPAREVCGRFGCSFDGVTLE